MKHLLIIIFLASTMAACASPVEKYIREHEPNIQTLEIIEEGPKDSLCSPLRTLMSATYFYSKCTTICVKADADSYDTTMSVKERVEIIKKAIEEVEQDMPDKKIFDNAILSVDFPHTSGTRNRIGQCVKYRLNGILQERIFVYNEDGENIGHTDLDIKQKAREAISSNRELDEAMRDLVSRLQELQTQQK